MKIFAILATALLLSSCGYMEDLWNRKPTTTTTQPPIDTTVPVLSENPGADITQYALKVDEKNEITVPVGSTVTLQEIEQRAIFSLMRTPSVGSFSEGNIDNALVITLKVLNVPNRTRVPFEITGIDATDIEAMVLNGASVPIALGGYFDLGAQGATGYANLVIIFKADQTTEGAETMNLRLISALSNANVNISAQINDTSRAPAPPITPQPEYILRKIPNTSANEGNVNRPTTIILTTVGVEEGSTVPWTITGISLDDIESMTVNGIPQTPALGGSFIVGGQGSAGMVLIFKADQTTEGSETMILGLPTVAGNPTISVTINDTSTTPPVPPPPVLKYTLTKNPSTNSFDEGNMDNVLSFRMTTENVNPGTEIPFTITGTGITTNDIAQMMVNGNSVTPTLTGNFIIGQQGAPNYATVELIFKQDATTEGTETLTFSVPSIAGVTPISVTINDTSTTPPVIVDTIPPLITLSYVNMLTQTNTRPAGGSAADNVGVVRVKWVNRTAATEGNATITSYGNIVAWTADVPVVTGTNDIDFIAYDAAGLTSTESTTVSGPQPPPPPPPADISAPTIQVTEQGMLNADGNITIYGIATDNVRVEFVTWINTDGVTTISSGMANGINNTGNTTWFANVRLAVGTNYITFTARDAGNNTALTTVTTTVSGTGQNSFDGPPEDIDPNRDLKREDEMMERYREAQKIRELGINTDDSIDLSSLNIPEPPAEVHPCNRGVIAQLPDEAWGKKFADYKNWSLFITPNRIKWYTDSPLLTSQFTVENGPIDHVNFYWLQKLGQNIHGAYDTGITIDNSVLKLGQRNAKLNTGYYNGSYHYSHYAGFATLPLSRVETCSP